MEVFSPSFDDQNNEDVEREEADKWDNGAEENVDPVVDVAPLAACSHGDAGAGSLDQHGSVVVWNAVQQRKD